MSNLDDLLKGIADAKPIADGDTAGRFDSAVNVDVVTGCEGELGAGPRAEQDEACARVRGVVREHEDGGG